MINKLRNTAFLQSLVVFFLYAAFFVYFQSSSIYGGDAGDLVTAGSTWGVAHPPGYPLYTLLANLMSYIPLNTIAWRVSLLSSLAMAASGAALYYLLVYVTKHRIASFIASTTLVCTYLFWLYAIIPEVFGLHILLMLLQLIVLVKWRDSKNHSLLYLFGFLFGLSLAHHHIIAFMVPTYTYVIWANRNTFAKKLIPVSLNTIAAIGIGALFNLYSYFAALGNPIYTWEDPNNLGALMRLIARSSYGTFTSASQIVYTPQARLTDLLAFGVFSLEDFTIIGIMLAIIGAAYQFKVRRNYFTITLISFLFTGPIFIFYGAYILSNSFTIATFERFLMPAYVFIAVWIAEGIIASTKGLIHLIHQLTKEDTKPLRKKYAVVLSIIFVILPASLFYINHPKVSVLKHDRTAEKHAQNILDTAEEGGILILANDNDIFNAAYEHFVNGYRNDIVFIGQGRFFKHQTNRAYVEKYPDLYVPENQKDIVAFGKEFADNNYDSFPIYSNDRVNFGNKYAWVRQGLLYKLYTRDDLPSVEEILNTNDELWSSYHDPLSGSLGTYRNLMLASILHMYRINRYDTANLFLVAQEFERAEEHFKETLRYDDSSYRPYIGLAQTQHALGKCEEAEESYEKALQLVPQRTETYKDLSFLYEDCFENEERATKWMELYEQTSKEQELPLEEL